MGNSEGYELFVWNTRDTQEAVVYEPMAFISSETRALAYEKNAVETEGNGQLPAWGTGYVKG